MDKGWDSGLPSSDLWSLLLRKAKPGAHLVAFGSPRTFHRLACAVEDAGWEIRDQLMWLYGTGMPKSLNLGKAIDKMDAGEEQTKRKLRFTHWVRSTGVTGAQIDAATNTNMGGHYTTAASQPAIMTREHLEACRALFREVPEWVERECDIRSVESQNSARRPVIGQHKKRVRFAPGADESYGTYTGGDTRRTTAATELARQWEGWGTTLKPAWEPILLARKPLDGTVAQNVIKYGTGALNIAACRIDGAADGDLPDRWPANLVLDESAAAMLDEQSPNASRFFYCPKASLAERSIGLPEGEKNGHPTVKPVALMSWLIRLVTQSGGLVCDPFMGSGSTGVAALAEGFRFLGIEQDAESHHTAAHRIAHTLRTAA
jgi:hypothetical protein